MKVTNFDAIASQDQQIVINGETYLLPGEIPVAYVLQLIGIQHEMEQNAMDIAKWDQMYDVIADVFKLRNPGMTAEKVKRMFTSRQTGKFIQLLMQSLGEAPEEIMEEQKKTPLEEHSAAPLEAVPGLIASS